MLKCNIRNKDIEWITDRCKNLIELNVSNNLQINIIKKIFTECKSLVNVNLNGCKINVTDWLLNYS